MEEEAVCPHARTCALYPLFRLKGALKIWQVRYCMSKERHKTCERFKRSCSGDDVPQTLLPNGDHIPT